MLIICKKNLIFEYKNTCKMGEIQQYDTECMEGNEGEGIEFQWIKLKGYFLPKRN